MSWSLRLKDKNTGETCKGKARENLGTMCCVGGTNELEFNITYNYSEYYREVEGFEKDSIRTIYGMTGRESFPGLEKLAEAIKNKYYNYEENHWKVLIKNKKFPMKDGEVLTNEYVANNLGKIKVEYVEIPTVWDEGDVSDYWKATARNAYRAILELIRMAEACPEGVWDGD